MEGNAPTCPNIKGVAWMEDNGETWGGAGVVARGEGGFPQRAQALARAAGVREGPSSSCAWAIRRAKRLRSRASCSQGPRRAAWAGPAQTTRRWTETFSEKRTWRQSSADARHTCPQGGGRRGRERKHQNKNELCKNACFLSHLLVTDSRDSPRDSLQVEAGSRC